MRLAAIDTGTNSTRLLISEIKSATKEEFTAADIIREMHITRLGKNLDKTGLIDKKNADKTVSVLKKYLDLINYYKIKSYRAVGTRALRHAANAAWFKGYVMDLLGLELEIISPQEEAMLSFTGAAGSAEPGFLLKINNILIRGNTSASLPYFHNTYPGDKEKIIIGNEKVYSKNTGGEILVLDIGGGSTEFITGSLSQGITFTVSINMGSVNVSEKFISDSLPSPGELGKMGEFIRGEIKGIMQIIREKNLAKVIGLAGTVSAIASVDLKLQKYDMKRLNGYKLDFKNILAIQEKFCGLGLKDRKKIIGLEPERADIIIGGTAILIEIMKGLKLQHVKVSENDILDGIIYSIF
jgi:exopolyphosphatase / guanosine-5'-triphosphate,3'-diphosphate pyrophosphatase